MEEDDKKFTIRKVPIEKFIKILGELYEMGLDYVDISCTRVSEIEDNVILGYQKDYMSSEATDEAFTELNELNDENDESEGLTDDDINQITL